MARFSYFIVSSLYAFCISTSSVLVAGQTASQADSKPQQKPQSAQNTVVADNEPELENEPDQTDIFAIPLDTSEDEEEQEMKELEEMQSEIQEEK